jgi:N utilization substance protein B
VSDEPRFDPWKRHRARRLALQALYQHQLGGSTAAELEEQFADRLDPERVEVAYFRTLVRDVTAEREAIEAHLEPVVDRGVRRLDPVERAALWIGVYELERRIDVPFRVVIEEAIGLVKLFGTETSHRMVNGVLDRLAGSLRAVEKEALRRS